TPDVAVEPGALERFQGRAAVALEPRAQLLGTVLLDARPRTGQERVGVDALTAAKGVQHRAARALFRRGLLGLPPVIGFSPHGAPQPGRVLVDRGASSWHRVSPTVSRVAPASLGATASLGTEPSVAR